MVLRLTKQLCIIIARDYLEVTQRPSHPRLGKSVQDAVQHVVFIGAVGVAFLLKLGGHIEGGGGHVVVVTNILQGSRHNFLIHSGILSFFCRLIMRQGWGCGRCGNLHQTQALHRIGGRLCGTRR